MRLLSLLLLCSFFVSACYATPPIKGHHSKTVQESSSVAPYGRAPYALLSPNFNCQAFTDSVSGINGMTLSVLWWTFGTETACLSSLLNSGQISMFELHLVNGPCIRNKRCGTYEPFYGYTVAQIEAAIKANDPKIKAKFVQVAQQAAQSVIPLIPDNVACYINPVLETNFTAASSSKIITWMAPYLPTRCLFVWNPVGPKPPGAPIAGATVSESHGMTPVFVNNQCIADTDGDTVSTVADWVTYYQSYPNCVGTMSWTPNDNCLSPGQAFIDPRARTCSDTSEFAAPAQAMTQASH